MLYLVWQDANKSTFGAVREIFEAHTPEARKTKLDALWAIFIEWHSDDVLFSYHRPREGESKLVYKPPIMNISTAAYDDVELILERIAEELIEGKGMKAVLCVGDQQTFSRMWHLKLDDPAKYFWVVPCSGDFHYQLHVASGVNRLAYAPLLQRFVNEADMSKTIKDKMNDTIHMKYIDHFCQLAIKSILTCVTDSAKCALSRHLQRVKLFHLQLHLHQLHIQGLNPRSDLHYLGLVEWLFFFFWLIACGYQPVLPPASRRTDNPASRRAKPFVPRWDVIVVFPTRS